MTQPLRPAAVAGASHIALFVAAAASAVVTFDQYDAARGPGGTWETLCWLGTGSGVLVFFGALFGSIIASRGERELRPRHAILAGAMTAILLMILIYLRREFAMEGGLFGAVIGSMLIPFLVSVRLAEPR